MRKGKRCNSEWIALSTHWLCQAKMKIKVTKKSAKELVQPQIRLPTIGMENKDLVLKKIYKTLAIWYLSTEFSTGKTNKQVLKEFSTERIYKNQQ